MSLSRRCFSILGLGLAVTMLLSSAVLAQGRGGGGGRGLQSQPVEAPKFQYMGPANAGRFAAIAGVPGDLDTYYLGAASGGLWKTSDGGETFEPLFDEQPVQAIGTIAIAPSDPNIIWVGTGEAWAIRDSDMMGDGVYKSTDAGATWTHMGLTESGRIGRMVIHPTDPDIVFTCALGRATGPQQERGVFRTTDGGQNWERVLFVDEDTGCSGLDMDSNNPDVLFAGTWDVVMHTWAMFSGNGPGSGVYVSRDGGDSWVEIDDPGLPTDPVGKIDVAIAPSDSQRVYALIQTADQGSVWRSDDGGENWRVVSWDRQLIGRAGYYIRIDVNPADADEVLIASSTFFRSTDGGATWPLRGGGCGDCHDIWMDPLNPDHWATTGDGGVGVTRDHGASFARYSLPIGQMYHVAVDNRVPYWIYSNRQDNGTMRGASDSPVTVPNVPSYYNDEGVGIGSRFNPDRAAGGRGGRGGGRGGRGGFANRGAGGTPWQGGIGGCESGFTIPDPTNPDVIYATCYGNKVTRYDDKVGRARSIEPYMITLDSQPDVIDYRCHWTPPLAFDPFDSETVYYGCQVIFRTQNRGQSWDLFSPDLSTQDPSRVVSSGGIIGDNLGQFYGEVVFAIAPSEIQQGLVWAGTNDGKVWYTDNDGGSWNDVTANVGMKEWGIVRKIEPSRFDPATAYMVVDYHMMDDRMPYLYKTTDLGRTWTSITGDLPAGHPLDYLMSFAENPNREGMLFVGSGHGFYYSMDDGASWRPYQEGLPAVPVSWIVVEPRYHDVVISTYGRGLFIMKDITQLEQQDAAVNAGAHLYEPRPGFRQARSGSAEFVYSLDSDATVTFHILDGGGNVLRTMEVPSRAGLNKTSWDLRYEGSVQVELRTVPPDNPEIWNEARFMGQETRTITHWGINGAKRAGPIAAPGGHTVRMTVDGRAQEQTFEILKDPAIPSPDDDLRASTAAQVRIRDAMNVTATMVNNVEIMRKQIEDMEVEYAGHDDLEAALAQLDRKILDVELLMLSETELHSDDKWFVEAYHTYQNLIWLNGEVGLGAGDVAGGAEYRPTDQSMATLARLEAEVEQARAGLDNLADTVIPEFNRAHEGRLRPIVIRR